jgi:hypothetical protein
MGTAKSAGLSDIACRFWQAALWAAREVDQADLVCTHERLKVTKVNRACTGRRVRVSRSTGDEG